MTSGYHDPLPSREAKYWDPPDFSDLDPRIMADKFRAMARVHRALQMVLGEMMADISDGDPVYETHSRAMEKIEKILECFECWATCHET